MAANSFICMTKVYKSHKFTLALYNKCPTFLPLIYSKNFTTQQIPHKLIMKYTSSNQNPLRQLKTAIETLPIQQYFFLILVEFRREEAQYDAGCFQHTDRARLLNFRKPVAPLLSVSGTPLCVT